MAEFKGTKGPWVVKTAFEGETENVIVKTRGKLLTVENIEGTAVSIIGRIGEEEQESNAKLIAAAPEMLAALVKVLQVWGWEHIGGNMHTKITSIIKKATE